MKVPGWDCADGTPEEDHDWEVIRDWSGNPEVINGTYDIVYRKCKQCGKEGEVTYDDLGHDYSGDNYDW